MNIAVIGSGISGMGAAWLLSQHHQVTLYEAEPRLGGHTHTVDVELDGMRAPVDTGFLVFNERTYPHLIALFGHLGIDHTETDMSLSVQIAADRLEWSGTSLNTLFGQRRNLVNPRFWAMLQEILRFNRAAGADDFESRHANLSLGDYLTRYEYSAAFRDWYLLPMAAAIWSCPSAEMLRYPVTTFSRFCNNHGLLQLVNRPKWFTVTGGARTYLERMRPAITEVHAGTPVARIQRSGRDATVTLADGSARRFDQVVLATHSDQALALLDDADPAEHQVLSGIAYQPNLAVLHTDASVLPSRRQLWSAWNFTAGEATPSHQPVSVHYLINRLQPLPFDTPVIVSLNPHQPIDPARVLQRIEYAHPVFGARSLESQQLLPHIQGARHTWFCGAWTGYGFHEDGLRSAVNVANALGCQAPWQLRPPVEQAA